MKNSIDQCQYFNNSKKMLDKNTLLCITSKLNIPDRQKVGTRLFYFLNKNPSTQAKSFFSHTKQFTPAALGAIPEDKNTVEASRKITDFASDNQKEIKLNSSLAKPTILKTKKRTPSPNVSLSTTGSLSPISSIPHRKTEKNDYKSMHRLPMPGTQALLLNKDYLTEAEKKEIIKYEQVYFFGHQVKKLSEDFCDNNGAYKAVIGDHLGFRYEILELIGKGTFGQVYKCYDYKREIFVAIKILRKNSKIRKQGEQEIKNLESINEKDLDDSKCLVKMLQCFEYRSHLCISFELLSINLYQFLKKTQFSGINLNLVKRIALQILIALRHIHGLGLIHCDLKLENILLKSECKTSIKVIDFGSASNYVNSLFSYVQSRYYRAPEVILGYGYDNKIDIWSLGCILVELFTGVPLFPGDNEHDQLTRIMAVLGEPPRELLEKSRRKACFFDQDLQPIIIKNKRGVLVYPSTKELIKPRDNDEIGFKDFITKCLEWDYNKRMSADEALKHFWIKGREG